MNLVLRILLSLWGYLWGVTWTVICGVMYLVGAPFDRDSRHQDFMQSLYGRGTLWGLGIPLRVEGEENIPERRAMVVMANHMSYLDIPALVTALRGVPLRFVAKRELLVIPFLGWALAASSHIKIDRKNRDQSVAALRRVAAEFRHGLGLAIFPEGTRSVTPRMLPLKKGGFHLARDNGIPILPVSIRGAQAIFGKKSLLMRPGSITVVVHPLVEVEGRERAEIPLLMAEVRAAILGALPESCAHEPPAGDSAP